VNFGAPFRKVQLHLKLFECLDLRPDGDLKGTPAWVYFRVSCQGIRKDRSEVLIETFIRKQLRLKAHTVTKVEEADDCMRVYRPARQSTVALWRLR